MPVVERHGDDRFRALARSAVRRRCRVHPGGRCCGDRAWVARLTQDIDVVYARARENLERLVVALAAHGPYLRGAPSGLPFRFDTQTLEGGLNFTLTTRLGDIDLLGEVIGGGRYKI